MDPAIQEALDGVAVEMLRPKRIPDSVIQAIRRANIRTLGDFRSWTQKRLAQLPGVGTYHAQRLAYELDGLGIALASTA